MSDVSIQWLIVFVDASVKAAFVALVVAAGLAMLRVRDSNLRHRVWTGVLCGMLLLPALTPVVPALRLPFTVHPEWFAVLDHAEDGSGVEQIPDQPAGNEEIVAAEPVADQEPEPIAVASTIRDDGRAMDARSEWPEVGDRWPGEFAGGRPRTLVGQDGTLDNDAPNEPPAEATAALEPEPEPAKANSPPAVARQPVSQLILSNLPLACWSLWIMGSLALGLRLLAGLWMARVLRGASRRIALEEFQAVIGGSGVASIYSKLSSTLTMPPPLPPLRKGGSHAGEPNITRRSDHYGAAELHGATVCHVPIAECPLIRVPLTLGVFRPQILLPLDWTDWPVEKLRAVLAHERTHAERGDCALALLAEVNRCLYWFHPLAWWLQRQLASLAEAACDDAAIGSTGDRASYARHLLEVAATARAHRGRLVAGSVSMARRSTVEIRINSILDFTRPLSQRLTRGTALILLGTIVPLIALAAALRPDDGREESTQYAVPSTQDTVASNQDAVLSPSPDSTQQPTQDERDDRSPADSANAEVRKTGDAKLSPGYSVLSTQPPANDAPAADAPFTFAGTVVDDRGEPFAGAKVSFSYFRKNPAAPDAIPALRTDGRGKFEFSVKTSDVSDATDSGGAFWTDAGFVAVKEGYGFAFAPAVQFETSGRIDSELADWQRNQLARQSGGKTGLLTLVRDDVPIRGRILNADGQPVVGARIEAFEFWEGKEGTLDAWETASKVEDASTATTTPQLRRFVRGHHINFNFMGGMGSAPSRRVTSQGNLFWGSRPPIVPPVISGADGWFTLTGVGRERIVELLISGPGIETTEQRVRTRAGDVVKLGLHKPIPHAHLTFVYYPHEFTLVSGPSIPITGRVTDIKTGQPLAGVGVQSTGHWKGAVTDFDGKYRLEGLPLGTNDLLVTPPAGSRHLAGGVHLTTTAGTSPLVRDISLTPGVLVRGRAVDETTGKPVRGNLQYFAYKSNPHVTESDSLHQGNTHTEFHLDADGRFEIPVLPGQGILALWAGTGFPDAVGADAVDCQRQVDGGNSIVFVTSPTWCIATAHNLLVPINPGPADEELMINLALRSGLEVPGRVLAPDGQPLDNYRIFGARRHVVWPLNLGKAFKVEGYNPSEIRRIIVYHEERDLVGHHDLTGEPPKEVEITLQPAATLVGRVLDADGSGAFPQVNVTNHQLSTAFLNGKPSVADLEHGVFQIESTTDSNGRFKLKGIVPGLKYTAHLNFFRPLLTEKKLKSSMQGPIFTDVTAEAGETKDLGDLVLELDSGKPAKQVKSEKPAAKGVDGLEGRPTESDTVTVTGIVLKPDGKPAAGATVRAAAPLWAMMAKIVGSDFKSPVSETKTDSQGKFAISFPTQPFGDVSRLEERWREIWKQTTVAASLPDFGPAWATYEEIEPNQPVTLRLVDDVPIRGKVVDLEGRPVVGAKIKLGEPRAAKGDDLLAWIDGVKAGELPWTVVDKAPRSAELRVLGLPNLLTTDAEGTFELRGLGRDRCLPLTFEGELVAHRDATVVTRDMPALQRKISNPPFESFEPVFGADFTFTAEPARAIEGIVRDAKTGEALAGVAVESDKLVGHPYSNHRVLKTTTDKLGRFRLIGMPKGTGNRLLLLPNDDQPYFMRAVDVPDPVGLGPAKMEIELHQGIWIGGRVTDKATGEPVPAVKMYYIPFLSNEHAQKTPEFRADENVDGDQWRYVTKPDGTYRLVGLPGRAIVGADSTLKSFRRGIGYDAIDAPKTNGWFQTYRNPVNPGPTWPTMMREINPAADAADVTLDFELDPGRSVKIRVVDRDGKPVTGVSGRGVSTGGSSKASPQAVVIAQNFGPNESRTVLLRHGERKIGRVLTITPAMVDRGEVSVELLPVSIVTGQLRRSQGGPVSGMDIEPRIMPDGLSDERPRGAVTNSEGKFEVELLPGCRYALDGRGGGFDYVTLTDELAVEPGETKDLGTLELGDDGKVVKPVTAKSTNGETPEDVGRPARPPHVGSNSKPTNEKVVAGLEGRPTQAITYRGRVVDPDGKPFAGARVCIVGVYGGFAAGVKNVPLAETKSRADGSFELEFSKAALERAAWGHSLSDAMTTIVALGDGLGPAFSPLSKLPPSGEVLHKLVRDDLPVTGRILDLEGRPVVGAKISVRRIAAPQQRDLNGFLKLIADGEVRTFAVFDSLVVLPEADGIPFPAATSDAQGRFRLTGIGRERYAEFAVSGPGIAYGEASVVTRPGTPMLMQEADPRMPIAAKVARRLFGAEFEYVALPSRPVTGLVRDAETGKAMPGVRVFNWRFASSPLNGVVVIDTFTDKSGRFRLGGMPVGEGNLVMIVPPSEQPYFSQQVAVTVDAKLDPIPLEIELHRGIWITGRVTDKVTGDPVSAVVHWLPYRTNEFAQKRTPEFGSNGNRDGWTDYPVTPDGTFRVLGLPGKALVAASVNTPRSQAYRLGVGSETFQPANAGGPQTGMMGPPGMLPMRLVWRAGAGGMRMYNSFQEIDVPETADSFECNVELDPGDKLRISVVDPEGKPISGCEVGGHLRPLSFQPVRVDESAFDLGALVAKEKRTLFINHQETRVGKVAVVEYDPSGPRDITISLEPCATIAGRIAAPEADLKSIKKLLVLARFEPLNGRVGRRQMGSCEIDAEGQFKFENLPVGCEYVVGYEGELDPAKAVVPFYQSKPFTVKPGQILDLGDVALQQAAPQLPQQQNDPGKAADKDVGRPSRPPEKDSTPSNAKGVDGLEGRPTEAPARKVSGRVVGANGMPIVGVPLQIPVLAKTKSPTGQDEYTLVTKATSDADGRFALAISDDDFLPVLPSVRGLPLIAMQPGFGVEWFDIPKAGEVPAVEIVLSPEQIIRGRMIDAEGRPVARAQITLQSLRVPRSGNSVDPFLEDRKISRTGAAKLNDRYLGSSILSKSYDATSDVEGRFVIRGVPAERVCEIKIAAEHFANATVLVVTRQGLDVAPYNLSPLGFGGRTPDLLVGLEFTHVGVPGQTIVGRVTVDGDKPVAGLVVDAGQIYTQATLGTTDANGRYRLSGLPRGKELHLNFALQGHGDLLPQSVTVPANPHEAQQTVDVDLKRGILVTGRVVDPLTGKGVRATLRFVLLAGNEYADKLANDALWFGGAHGLVDDEGKFQVAVIPGPGALLATASFTATDDSGQPFSPFIRSYVSKDDEVKLKVATQPFGGRAIPTRRELMGIMSENAVKYINLEEGSVPQTVDIMLDRGKTLELELVDVDGQPVMGAAISGIHEGIRATRLRDSRTTVYALDGESPRSVVALQATRGLAGTLKLTGEEASPVRLVLGKAASIRGRAVDPDGAAIPLVEIDFFSEATRGFSQATRGLLELENPGRPKPTTDKEGRFRFENMIPGESFRLFIRQEGTVQVRTARLTKEQQTLKPGQDVDFGDVVFEGRQLPPQGEAARDVGRPSRPPEKSGATNSGQSNGTGVDGLEGRPTDVGRPARPPEKSGGPNSGQTSGNGADRLEGRPTQAGESITYRGRVVDPDGKPFAGASLRVEYYRAEDSKKKPTAAFQTTSATDGRFRFSIPKSEFDTSSSDEPWNFTSITATADGFGFDEVRVKPGQTDDLRLQLAKDVPINGRILSLEGTPIVGAVIRMRGVSWNPDGNLDSYINALGEGRQNFRFEKFAGGPFASTEAIRTDSEGRFRLRGMGAERMVELYVESSTIEHWWINVLTRETKPVVQPLEMNSRSHPDRAYGASFDHLAPPARLIVGNVHDRATGNPLVGATVRGTRSTSRAKTDEAGRFELYGVPKSREYNVEVIPATGQPYFVASLKTADTPGLEPIVMDVAMTSGTLCRGQLTDKATGQPVAGELQYYPLYPNEAASKFPQRAGTGTGWSTATIKRDGQFVVAVLPGPGVLAFRASGSKNADYAPAFISSEELETYFGRKLDRNNSDEHLGVAMGGQAMGGFLQHSYDALALIDPKEAEESFTRNMALEPGRKVHGILRGPDDQPLTGATASGLRRNAPETTLETAEFEVLGLSAKRPRLVLFTHNEKKLGLALTVNGDEPQPLVVQLKPLGAAVGRLLDKDGEPVRSTTLNFYRDRIIGPGGCSAKTDDDGRFRVEGLVPGQTYMLTSAEKVGGMMRLATFSIESGETKDLGELRIKPSGATSKPQAQDVGRPTRPSAQNGASGSTQLNGKAVDGLEGRPTKLGATDSDAATVVRGRVTSPDGKPAAKAHVAVIGIRSRQERGGDLSSRSEVLSAGETGDDGRFELQLSGISSKTHSWVNVIARADNSGLAWRRVDPDSPDVDVSLELPAEQLIRGRLIDIEGQPAEAVRISVTSIVPSAKASPRGEGVGFHKFGQPPPAWPPSVIANSNGGFAIHGIPADYGVYLKVDGTDRFAPQEIALNTGAPEQRPQNDATYRSLIRNIKPGEEAVLPLAPAQIFEGVVRYADTGEPAPYARLTIWASQQESSGSMTAVPGKADAEGHYRINPNPGVRFGITAYPPDGVPYLIRATPDIKHKEDSFVKRVDITLPRGVLVRGQVVESTTKAPLAGAAIQYVPERATSANAPNDVVTGWQGIQLSGVDGAFEIAVLPGPGTLLVNGPNGNFVSQEIGSQQLSNGRPGGERNYAHAIHRVAPDANADPLDVTIELKPGTAVSGRITTGTGEPVEKALLITRLNLRPSELTWRGFPLEALRGRFELAGLAEGTEYPVHFLDAKNRLGATSLLKADEQAPTVVLLPCGEAVATFVDAEGKPVTGHRPLLEIVVTPGSARLDLAALRLGILAADAAYMANVDRANYWDRLRTDADGRATFPALIPGANYRVITYTKGMPVILKEFVGESAKTLDLGKITIEVPKEE